jgi:hypothetical protein
MPAESSLNSNPETTEAERDRKAREEFERGLLDRGEAAPLDKNGELPPGKTHEIVGYDEANRPILRRRRFSIL